MQRLSHYSATRIGTIEMVLAMMLSGTIGYFVLSAEQSFWNVVFFRCVIGAMTLGAYAYWKGMLELSFLKQQLTKNAFLLIVIGGITLVANWILLFASFNYIPFSISTVVYHTQPLFLVLLGAYITGDKLSWSLFFWLALAFAGLFLMLELDFAEIRVLLSAEGQAENSSHFASVFGLLMALSAALLYTVTTLVTKKVSHVPPHLVALVQVIVGVVMLLPFADFADLPSGIARWFDLIILGVVHTGFMYIIMYDSFQKLPTGLLALLSFIYPVMALIVDFWAFNTLISWLQGVGVLMILLAACAVKFDWRLPRVK